jgi:hypothetical protein
MMHGIRRMPSQVISKTYHKTEVWYVKTFQWMVVIPVENTWLHTPSLELERILRVRNFHHLHAMSPSLLLISYCIPCVKEDMMGPGPGLHIIVRTD